MQTRKCCLNDDIDRQNWKTDRTDEDEFCRILIKTVRNFFKKVRYIFFYDYYYYYWREMKPVCIYNFWKKGKRKSVKYRGLGFSHGL